MGLSWSIRYIDPRVGLVAAEPLARALSCWRVAWMVGSVFLVFLTDADGRAGIFWPDDPVGVPSSFI